MPGRAAHVPADALITQGRSLADARRAIALARSFTDVTGLGKWTDRLAAIAGMHGADINMTVIAGTAAHLFISMPSSSHDILFVWVLYSLIAPLSIICVFWRTNGPSGKLTPDIIRRSKNPLTNQMNGCIISYVVEARLLRQRQLNIWV